VNSIVVVVGMIGAGKSTAVSYLESKGYIRVYFGQPTFDEMKKRGLDQSEQNETIIRESLRREHGMAVYADRMLPVLAQTLKLGPVVIESLYSWEELLEVKRHYAEQLTVVAISAPKKMRQERLVTREERPLTYEEFAARDKSQIENLNTGGPIAIADYTIVNETEPKHVYAKLDNILSIV
jgi:dephospho-CoA kinase